MAANAGFPKWLLDSKEHITRSKVWSSFVEELYDAVQQQLKESHVNAFTDLTEPERQLFMERAAKAIATGTPYQELYKHIGSSLDQFLNNEVARQLLEDYPINTKSDLILDSAQDGAISLLRKWPDMKSKLHICFNQPLPKPLRQLTWRLYLENTKVRKKYVDILSGNPRTAISALDLQISQKCEQLILAEPTFDDLKGSVGAFYGMKAVLSYHHALQKSSSNLPETDFLLVIPLVVVAANSISKREPAAGHVVALMVEEYFTLMQSRPGYMIDSGSETQDAEAKGFASRVADHLLAKSPDTAKSVTDACVPSKERIVVTETGTQAILSDGVRALVRPLITSLFVGYLNMDVVLFIWDQYVIGFDAPGYHDEYLPAVTAVFLMLVQDKLKDCHSPAALDTALKKEGVKLKVPQFQYEINKHFYQDLFGKLNQDDRAAMPVLDPTQANLYPPWAYWFNDKVPPRTTPMDRRLVRDEREAERERLLQQERDLEIEQRINEEKGRRDEENLFLEQQAHDRQRQEEERMGLEDQLEKERRRRVEGERRAAEEIERLRLEIDDMRRKRARSPAPSAKSMDSVYSRFLLPPPPSAASDPTWQPPVSPMNPPRTQIRSPAKRQPKDKQTDQVINDLLTQVSNGFNRVAHGTGAQKRTLDEETKESIRHHREDVKTAEKEIFGRNLEPGEFEKMPEEQRAEVAEDIMEIIRRLIEERRKSDKASQT